MYIPRVYDGKIPIDQYLREELSALQETLAEPVLKLTWREVNVAPDKPRNGDLVLADGTNWNPGAGRGHYEFVTGVGWVFRF